MPDDHLSVTRSWQHLGKEEQTRLLIEYGHYQDDMPKSCDMAVKEEWFSRWLSERGISYQHNASDTVNRRDGHE